MKSAFCRLLIVFLAFGPMSALLANAQTQYPERPVRMIVSFGPGSVTDQLARILATHLTERLGQPFIVENKVGAGGNIGNGFVATGPTDGYTLLMGAASTVINQHLYTNLSFSPLKDLVPIANVASVANVLVVNPEIRARSIPALINELKAGSFSYASGGAGGSQHLSAELFKSLSKTDMTHIPYKGGSEPLPDLMANRVQIMFCNLPVCLPHVRSGKLAAIGVTSLKRSTLLPNVPTISEDGLPGYSVDGWFGLFGPAKLPPTVVARLHKEVEAVLSTPAVAEQIRKLGAEPNLGTQPEFARFVQAESVKWAKVIRDANIKVE